MASEQPKGPLLIITVTLSSGMEKEHRYEMSQSLEEILVFAVDLFRDIAGAFMGEVPAFTLTNPHTSYNQAHVAAVSVRGVGSEELQEAIRRQTQTIGFRPEGKDE